MKMHVNSISRIRPRSLALTKMPRGRWKMWPKRSQASPTVGV